MKKIFIVVLSFLILSLLIVCSNSSTKEVTLKEIDINEIKDEKLEEVLMDIGNDGIYGLETNKNKYIVFNGLENDYKDIDYELEDDVLKITFSKGDLVESTKKIYEISPFPTEEYETLILEEDGENVVFNGVEYIEVIIEMVFRFKHT